MDPTINEVRKIAVVGAGVMGHGIAQACAKAGYQVVLIDTSEALLSNAMSMIKRGPFGLMKLVERGKIENDEVDRIINRIDCVTDLAKGAKDADVVVESVSENLELKKQIHRQLDELSTARTVFASNTSTMLITDLASATKRPDKFIGMHWFNPAQVQKLIEVIRGISTSDETFDLIVELSKKLGKVPIEAKDGPGFLTSRFLGSVTLEAVRLFEQGIAGIKEIDQMCESGLGFAMGPFKLMDLMGLDTVLHAADYIYNLNGELHYKPPVSLRKLATAGYIGDAQAKPGSKGGWYAYYGISKE